MFLDVDVSGTKVVPLTDMVTWTKFTVASGHLTEHELLHHKVNCIILHRASQNMIGQGQVNSCEPRAKTR